MVTRLYTVTSVYLAKCRCLMCYDIAFATSIRAITDYFPELILDPQLNLDFTQDHVQGSGVFGEHPILFVNKAGEMHLHPMSWSVVEFWQKTPLDMKDFKVIKKRNGYLNARLETTSGWQRVQPGSNPGGQWRRR